MLDLGWVANERSALRAFNLNQAQQILKLIETGKSTLEFLDVLTRNIWALTHDDELVAKLNRIALKVGNTMQPDSESALVKKEFATIKMQVSQVLRRVEQSQSPPTR